MSRFTVLATPIPDLKLIQRHQLHDSRGFFTRIFCNDELASIGCSAPITQINHSYTQKKGTVRGLHFQAPPQMEHKLVSCLRGAVWDIAVDMRVDSPSFLQWFAAELSSGNLMSLCIPPGFAHGFQALTDDCELLYAHTTHYRPDAESGINVCDPALNIPWPLPIEFLSIRDHSLPMTDEWVKELNV